MKSLLTIVLAFVFTSQAFAASGIQELYNELNYTLTVEWDQKDEAFYKKTVDAFIDQVKELEASGMDHHELITFAVAQIKNEKAANEARALFHAIEAHKLSTEEIVEKYLDFKETRIQGAQWSTGATIGLIAGVVVVGAVVYAVLKVRHDTVKNSIGNVR